MKVIITCTCNTFNFVQRCHLSSWSQWVALNYVFSITNDTFNMNMNVSNMLILFHFNTAELTFAFSECWFISNRIQQNRWNQITKLWTMLCEVLVTIQSSVHASASEGKVFGANLSASSTCPRADNCWREYTLNSSLSHGIWLCSVHCCEQHWALFWVYSSPSIQTRIEVPFPGMGWLDLPKQNTWIWTVITAPCRGGPG